MVSNRQTSEITKNCLPVRVEAVSKEFTLGRRRVSVLRDISFDATPGQLTIITGPSGSGKTTLLRIVGGLSKPGNGSVAMGTTSLYRLNDRRLSQFRNHTMGFIFQDYRLILHYNALENVMVPLKIAGLPLAEQKKRALQSLTLVGLAEHQYKRIDQLSGGQQQRVSIARALAMKPDVLIADEPTGNLDSATGSKVMQLLHSLKDQYGLSIVMVTHDEKIAATADHLIQLIDGRIVKDSYANA